MKSAALLLVAFACSNAFASGLGLQTQTFGDLAAALNQIDSVSMHPSTDVTLCHIPPGNPANARTIVVRQAAVAAHLAHGDSLGECLQVCSDVAPVPKTGQTICWDEAENVIDCDGTGQDGEYQKGVSVDPRFADNGDGTVEDNLTGLIWLKDAGCLGGMPWSRALSTASALAAATAPVTCGLADGSVAGDWRLPNLKELQSLIDYGRPNPALPLAHPFIGVQSLGYWSSTSYVNDPLYAWCASFNDGAITRCAKFWNPWVWPVRGGR